MVSGIVCGVLLGAVLISHVPSKALQAIFVAYAVFVAIQVLAKMQPKFASGSPGRLGMAATGGTVGGASMLADIMGASIAIPFMLWSRICPAFGKCVSGDKLDSEVSEMIGKRPVAEPLFIYARYNADIIQSCCADFRSELR